MSLLRFIPFFYFQKTRLNNGKAWAFHSLYEWLPAWLLVIYEPPGFEAMRIRTVDLLIYYLAFISLYEIGYMANDQLAHQETDGRKRSEHLSMATVAIFIFIRVSIFAAITFYLHHLNIPLWWGWFASLGIVFTLHNIIRLPSLKVITFCFLALFRFFSPLFLLVSTATLQELLFPVFLNYVVYRMFIYMDSKGLLHSFDRKARSYRLGFYLLTFGFCVLLTLLSQSLIPAGIGMYYLLVAVLLVLGQTFVGLEDK